MKIINSLVVGVVISILGFMVVAVLGFLYSLTLGLAYNFELAFTFGVKNGAICGLVAETETKGSGSFPTVRRDVARQASGRFADSLGVAWKSCW
jgi:hypothetical protein